FQHKGAMVLALGREREHQDVSASAAGADARPNGSVSGVYGSSAKPRGAWGEAHDGGATAECQFHADAEGHQRRLRCATAEGVDEERLLCPDPTGADRYDRCKTLRRLHE